MKRAVCVLVGLLMLFMGAENLLAQTFGPIPGAWFFSSIPTLGLLEVGDIRLTGTCRIGYQWIGLNFNLPTLAAIAGGDGSAPIDIELRGANFWVGSVGLEAHLSPRVSLFANGEANTRQNADVITSEDPLRHYTGLLPYQWDASNLQWWTLEGGAAFEVVQGATVFAGLRRDYLSYGLDNPRDPFGSPINFTAPQMLMHAAADFQAKLWVPYVGVRLTGTNYRSSVIWSPFANSAVKIPDVFQSKIGLLGATTLTGVEWRYSMFQPGGFLEGLLEYDVSLGPNVFFNLWVKGSWLRVSGPGNLDEILNEMVHLVTFPPIDIFSSVQGNQSATATLTRTLTAFGLSARLEF